LDDPFTSWDIPRGLLYSDNNVKAFVGTVMDTFNPKWFRRGAHRLDPLRHAWSTKGDPYSVMSLCRVGRDIWKLKQRQDPGQNVYLSGLVQRAKTANREHKGMEDYLYELHTAMLFDDAHGAVGELAVPSQDGYDATVRLSRGRTLWISYKRLHTSQGEELFARATVELREAMGAIAARHGHRTIEGVVYTQPPLTTIARDHLLDAWNDLCGIYDGQVATQVARDEFFLRIDQSIMLFSPGIDPRTLQSAVAVQFLSGMPVGEHERVRKVIQTAQNQLRVSATPTVLAA